MRVKDGQVHGRQAPGGGVGFLAVDTYIAQFAAVGFDELFRLHKHAAAATAGVVHLALVRGQHGHQCFDDAGWGVELPATLAFGTGEHAQKVFVYLAQHVAGHGGVVAKADLRDQVHQLAQLAVGQLRAGVALVQNAFELGVFKFDQHQGVVDELAYLHAFGHGSYGFPARAVGHPEDVGALVIVAVFQLGGQVFWAGVGKVEVVGRVLQPGLHLQPAGGEGV
ncbi:MAG: hypothetical protein RLZZ591_2746 [Pseudomonadota bacterium]